MMKQTYLSMPAVTVYDDTRARLANAMDLSIDRISCAIRVTSIDRGQAFVEGVELLRRLQRRPRAKVLQ